MKRMSFKVFIFFMFLTHYEGVTGSVSRSLLVMNQSKVDLRVDWRERIVGLV